MKTVHLVDPELRPLLALMPERILEASILPAMREERQRAALQNLSQDDGLDMPGHRGVRGFQALRSGEQAAAALQLKKKPQVIPVEHVASLSMVPGRVISTHCLKTHSSWVKTNIFKTKTNN